METIQLRFKAFRFVLVQSISMKVTVCTVQYSNVGCSSANIIRVHFFGGEGGACSLNGVEYTYV